MIVIAWTLGLYIPIHLYGGVGEMFARIDAARPELLTVPGLAADGSPWTFGGYSSAILVSAIGFMMWPHLFMKAFVAKDDATIRRTIALFPTFQVFLVPLFIVGFAAVLYPMAPPQPDAVMPHMVLSTGLPDIVVGLFCAGALAAGMSTGDTLVHGAASMAVEDIVSPMRARKVGDAARRNLIRWLTVVAGVIGYVIALASGRSLVGMLLLSYGAIVQLAPGVYSAFLWRRATGAGVVAGLMAGITVTAVLVIRPDWRPYGLHEGMVGLVANLLTLGVVSLVTRPPDEQQVATWYNISRGRS